MPSTGQKLRSTLTDMPSRDDELLAVIAQWSSDERRDRASGSRLSKASHRQLAEAEARFQGLIVDLAERNGQATFELDSGRRVSGIAAAVGNDFCALTREGGSLALVAAASIRAVELEGNVRSFPLPSDRFLPERPSLIDVLGELAVERRRVQFTYRGDTAVHEAEVVGVGQDMCILALGSPPTRLAYLRTDHLGEIMLV